MKPFKFLEYVLAYSHNDEPIYAGEIFYTMNKEEFQSVVPGRIIPKYTIVRRCVHPKYKDRFKPDYKTLLYFKTEESAEFYKGRLIHWGEHVVRSREIGKEFHRQADHIITYQHN